MNISPALQAIIDEPRLFLPRRPADEWVSTPGYTLLLSGGPNPSPTPNRVVGVRLGPDDVQRAVAEVRAELAARGRRGASWEIGPSATPPDLVARLSALGLVPHSFGPAANMVLTRPPPAPPPGIRVQPVLTLDDHRTSERLLRKCFGLPDPEPDAMEAGFAEDRASGRHMRYLAFQGDAPIASGIAIYLDAAVVMLGGVTLPEARGLGAYRALCAARWEEAVRRGTPALVVQAGSMSRPILEGLGFVTLGETRVLVDAMAEAAG